MDEKIYEVTWAVTGSVRVKAVSSDAAMTKIENMTLREVMDLNGAQFNGPDATYCEEVEP
jgi:hypothetical protein